MVAHNDDGEGIPGGVTHSKKHRLLKPRPGDQNPTGRRGAGGDRVDGAATSEAEDALAAWRKYRFTTGSEAAA